MSLQKIFWGKIRQAILDDPSYKEGDIHQAILNIGYNEWQKNKGWGYEDMLEWVELTYGKEFRMLIQLGKYNQQVCNGGHVQYFDNGYASNGGGFGSNHDADCPLHEWLCRTFDEYLPVAEIKHAETVRGIMGRFVIEIDDNESDEEQCDTCNGSGHVEEDGLQMTCSECGGTGRVDVHNDNYGSVCNTDRLDTLDDQYYEVYEEFMTSLNEWILKSF